jgi:hypothetical protein
MLFSKLAITYSLVGVLLSYSSPVSAIAPVKPTQKVGEIPKRVDEKSARIKRVTNFVLKIEGNVLYTENNRYNLSGVKILDLRKDKQISSTTVGQKNIVEMIFIDDQLHKVVIRQ